MRQHAFERSNGEIYRIGTTMSMMLFFYMVIKDTQREYGQPRHRFQKSPFWSVFTETQPQSFQTKTGSAGFSKVSIFEGGKMSSVIDRRNCSKSYAF